MADSEPLAHHWRMVVLLAVIVVGTAAVVVKILVGIAVARALEGPEAVR